MLHSPKLVVLYNELSLYRSDLNFQHYHLPKHKMYNFLLLIQFYYLRRIQQLDAGTGAESNGIGSEEFLERIFDLHENALAELHSSGP